MGQNSTTNSAMESVFWLNSIWRCYSIFSILEHFEADFTRQNDHFKECLAAATKLHFFEIFFFWGLPKYKKEHFEGGSIFCFDFIPPLKPGYGHSHDTISRVDWTKWLLGIVIPNYNYPDYLGITKISFSNSLSKISGVNQKKRSEKKLLMFWK